jgi:hypothetical protein
MRKKAIENCYKLEESNSLIKTKRISFAASSVDAAGREFRRLTQSEEETMRRLLTTTALLGIGIACASHATAQGPVREGLRSTGELAVEGTQRVIQSVKKH